MEKREALEITRDLFDCIYTNGYDRKIEAIEELKLPTDMVYDCALCQYVEERYEDDTDDCDDELFPINNVCLHCPLLTFWLENTPEVLGDEWISRKPCCREGSPFDLWDVWGHMEGAREICEAAIKALEELS